MVHAQTNGTRPVPGFEEIRDQVKEAIAKVSGVVPAALADDTSYREDLGLDSLSVIELVVEVQYRFRIPDLPDDRELSDLKTVGQTVEMVRSYLLAG